MMDFEWMFHHHVGRRIDKWRHYFPIYDRHFDRFRSKGPRVLEIGVDHGGSLQLWKRYFGPSSRIVGLDIDPRCANYAEDQIEIHIGNQSNVALLRSLGTFDIVIDDGSHRLQDQEASLETLWPATRSLYLIEDCHGGLNTPQYPAYPRDALAYTYPWALVVERPQRLIRGEPSRTLRPDEEVATERFKCL